MSSWPRSAAAIAVAALLLAGLAVVVPALGDIEPPSSPSSTAPESARAAARRSTATSAEVVEQAAPAGSAVAPDASVPVDVPTELVVEPAPTTTIPPGPRNLMLIGDSMAFTAALGLAPHAGGYGFTLANEGINGCGVVRGGPYRYFGAQRDMEPRCEQWPQLWKEALDRNGPDVVAIVVGRWELMDRVYQGRWTNVFDPAFVAYVESELDVALAIAQSGGARAVVFTTPYYRRGTAPGGGLFPEDDPARVDVVNGILRRVAERWGATVVDVGAWLSPEGRYTRDVGGVRVRSDGVHLTRQTGDLLAPWLFPQLA